MYMLFSDTHAPRLSLVVLMLNSYISSPCWALKHVVYGPFVTHQVRRAILPFWLWHWSVFGVISEEDGIRLGESLRVRHTYIFLPARTLVFSFPLFSTSHTTILITSPQISHTKISYRTFDQTQDCKYALR